MKDVTEWMSPREKKSLNQKRIIFTPQKNFLKIESFIKKKVRKINQFSLKRCFIKNSHLQEKRFVQALINLYMGKVEIPTFCPMNISLPTAKR